MGKEAKYLCVEFHDNDFTGCWVIMGDYIKDIVWYSRRGDYPELSDEQLKIIKQYIARIMWANFNMERVIYWNDFEEQKYDYFYEFLRLSIVNYLSIPDWDNGESMYIPLFDEKADIIFR